MRVTAALCGLLIVCGAARAAQPIPGGFLDNAGAVVYFVDDKDRLTAVEVASGKSLWAAPRDCTPLALVGDRLVGWANGPKNPQFHLVTIDAKTGKRVAASVGYDLPNDWPGGTSFEVAARAEKGELVVEWAAVEQRVLLGIPQGPFTPRTAGGTLGVELATGKVRVLAVKKPPAPGLPAPPAGRADAPARGRWDTEYVVADVAAAPEIAGAPGAQKLTLTAYDRATGNRVLKPVELMTGAELSMFRSGDGRHLVVRDTGAKGDGVHHLFELTTGKSVGKARLARGAAPPTVAGRVAVAVDFGPEKHPNGTVAYVRSAHVRAYDLTTGKELWARAREPLRIPVPTPLPP